MARPRQTKPPSESRLEASKKPVEETFRIVRRSVKTGMIVETLDEGLSSYASLVFSAGWSEHPVEGTVLRCESELEAAEDEQGALV